MKNRIAFVIFCLASTLGFQAGAQIIYLEPDAFTNGTVLDHVLPQVNLTTAGANNLPIPPVSFPVTATYDGFHFASTGTNVFGQAGVQFWNTNRRLRMDFNAPVTALSIDFIGGDLFTNDIAELDVFNAAGTLVAAYISSPRAPGEVETLTVSRPLGDVAWAVAYAQPGDGNFIRLDNLRFTAVPEPGAAALVVPALAMVLALRQRVCWRAKR